MTTVLITDTPDRPADGEPADHVIAAMPELLQIIRV
jgi:hypothetical protein